MGGVDRNRGVPSRSERGAPGMRDMCRGPYHDATNTLSRRAVKCTMHPDTTLPNTNVEGTAKQRQRKPTDACECWKRSVAEMDEPVKVSFYLYCERDRPDPADIGKRSVLLTALADAMALGRLRPSSKHTGVKSYPSPAWC